MARRWNSNCLQVLSRGSRSAFPAGDSPEEAVGGGKVKVPTVDGAVMMTVPPRTNSGAVLRIKGRGFTNKAGGRGDQLVTLMIHLPTDQAELARLNDVLSDTSVRENISV